MMAPHHAYPHVTLADIAAELARECALRRRVLPGMAEKGKITGAEAGREIALMDAVAEDAARFERALAGGAAGLPMVNPLTIARRHAFSWSERRACLTRELAYRARLYPGWLAKGRLTAAEAERQCDRIACMRALYELGWDWEPANGTMPGFASSSPTPAQRESQQEWYAIMADIAARDGHSQQRLAL